MALFPILFHEICGLEVGTHSIEFDGSDLNSGIYFYTLKSKKGEQTKKMILLK